ncbi:MAG TPA: DUF4389 domain-containing protein [Vicinamibacterales bacterium]|jgi:hypothetical protein
MAYPVSVTVEPRVANRNRLTTAFRIILAIPHFILVGGLGVSVLSGGSRNSLGGETGILGAVAILLAIVSWFTIVIAGSHASGIRQFTLFFLRWRVRALAYVMLLEDQYPPFGDLPYPAAVSVVDPAGPRRRLSVFFRILLVIPNLVVLGFVMVAWMAITVVAWFTIVIAGSYPAALYHFSAGALRWSIRLEAYLLLLVDDYPPFSLG